MGNEAMTDTTNPQALAPTGTSDGRIINAFSSTDSFMIGQRMARAISCSSLLPKEYQGEKGIPNVMIAMELASRIGMPVLAVMQNIDIIHGRPSWRATFLIATVNACGRFTPLRFRWQGTPTGRDSKTFGCRAVARDRETDEECVGALITLGMAEAEGWATKSGSKWKTMPEQMLMYRAAAFWSRVYAPELSLGMRTADEAEDLGPAEAPQVQQLEAMRLSPLASKLEPQPQEPVEEDDPPHDPETGEVREPGDDHDEDEA
jgi:hypothetical protein